MNPFEKLKSDAAGILAPALGTIRKDLGFEVPPQGISADLAFTCFHLAKEQKKSPIGIAKQLAEKIRPRGLIQQVKANGPYLNFFADWNKLGNLLLKEIISSRGKYGSSKCSEKIMIEFAQPNTHKAIHIGHARNLAFGESLCRILEFTGRKVIRVNYQGDIGPHVAKCIWGLLHLGLKEPSEGKGLWLGEVYAKASQAVAGNDKKEQEVREINKLLYAGDKKLTALLKKTRKWSLDYFEEVYKDFGTEFDRLYFESEVEGPAKKLAMALLKKGIAKKSQGAVVIDLESDGLGIYVLLTQDLTPLYSVKDFVLAELQDKEHKPDKILHVVAAEQTLHFKQLFKSLGIVNPPIAKKEIHLPYEFVNLKSGKMSSRTGDVITYDSLKQEMLSHAVEETKKHMHTNLKKTAELVALGGIKYDMLKQSPSKVITFDWKQALSFEGNAAPYLQYTHARACSILAKEAAGKWNAKNLVEEKEVALMKRLIQFPSVVESAAKDYRPHYLANYSYELSSLFNDFYQAHSVLRAEPQVKHARLALVKAVKDTLASCLRLMGIEAPEKM